MLLVLPPSPLFIHLACTYASTYSARICGLWVSTHAPHTCSSTCTHFST
jgi:hypothetical protein